MTGRRNGERGFTLLEVMVAVGILATTLVVLLTLRNRDVELQTYTRERTVATLLARDLVFDAEYDKELFVGYLEGDFEPDYPGYSWQRTVIPFMPEMIGERVWEVRVSVRWGEDRFVELTRFIEAKKAA